MDQCHSKLMGFQDPSRWAHGHLYQCLAHCHVWLCCFFQKHMQGKINENRKIKAKSSNQTVSVAQWYAVTHIWWDFWDPSRWGPRPINNLHINMHRPIKRVSLKANMHRVRTADLGIETAQLQENKSKFAFYHQPSITLQQEQSSIYMFITANSSNTNFLLKSKIQNTKMLI